MIVWIKWLWNGFGWRVWVTERFPFHHRCPTVCMTTQTIPTCRLHDYNYLCIIQHKFLMTLCYLHNHFPLRISVVFHLCCLFIWIRSSSSPSECNLDSELTSLLHIHLLLFLFLIPYHYLSSSLYLPLSYSYIDYLHSRMGCLSLILYFIPIHYNLVWMRWRESSQTPLVIFLRISFYVRIQARIWRLFYFVSSVHIEKLSFETST